MSKKLKHFSHIVKKFTAHNDLISAKQQPHVLCRIFADLVQILVRGTVSGVFLARMLNTIQVWPTVEVMRRDFNEYYMTQVPMTENQLGEVQIME